MSYADILERAHFAKMADNYFWREIRATRREENARDLATAIADDVIADGPSGHRKAFIEETVDDGIENLLRDLLDDLKAGVNPTETIRRRISNWSTGVAQYEIERGEA
jgi:hypothetical protein